MIDFMVEVSKKHNDLIRQGTYTTEDFNLIGYYSGVLNLDLCRYLALVIFPKYDINIAEPKVIANSVLTVNFVSVDLTSDRLLRVKVSDPKVVSKLPCTTYIAYDNTVFSLEIKHIKALATYTRFPNLPELLQVYNQCEQVVSIPLEIDNYTLRLGSNKHFLSEAETISLTVNDFSKLQNIISYANEQLSELGILYKIDNPFLTSNSKMYVNYSTKEIYLKGNDSLYKELCRCRKGNILRVSYLYNIIKIESSNIENTLKFIGGYKNEK